jgi:GrpB-like predicted nucleotidyltransferase (UPF0157 family)
MKTVTLLEHQPQWRDDFAAVAAELAQVFGAGDVQIEHIGSTAVLGLCAKPTIDVLLAGSSLDAIASRAEAMALLGYRYRREHEAVVPERRYFTRPAAAGPPLAGPPAYPPVRPPVHVHGVVSGGRIWGEQLAFRDALRADTALAAEYARLKRTLAVQHAQDAAAYTDAKAPFVTAVLKRLLGAALQAKLPATPAACACWSAW